MKFDFLAGHVFKDSSYSFPFMGSSARNWTMDDIWSFGDQISSSINRFTAVYVQTPMGEHHNRLLHIEHRVPSDHSQMVIGFNNSGTIDWSLLLEESYRRKHDIPFRFNYRGVSWRIQGACLHNLFKDRGVDVVLQTREWAPVRPVVVHG